MQTLLEEASDVLHKNWKGSFTIPCEGLYPFQWNWDSGFIAIGWAHIDPERAKQELRSLLKGQWTNGFIPHIVFHNPSDTYYPGPEVHDAGRSRHSPEIPTSGITQPPVLGFVLQELFEILEDKKEANDFINEVYDSIYNNISYFYSNRDPHNEGLVYICHNWEAGTDNTPVWDFIWETFDVPEYELDRKDTKLIDASHRPTNKEYQYYIHLIELFKAWNYDDKAIADKSPFLVQDPLFNSMLLASCASMIFLGEKLNKTAEVKQLVQWYDRGRTAMNTKLFDVHAGGYVYYDLRNDRSLKFLSSSSFTPLFAKIPTKEQLPVILRNLKGGAFSGKKNENYLCASFDPGSKYFNSKKYWRGPIWINLNWIIYRGLLRYKADEIAEIIRNDTLDLIRKYGFYEYFEPSKSLNKELTQGYGGNNFSWSAALIIDMLTKNK